MDVDKDKQAMCAWSFLTLFHPMEYISLGSSVHGIFQTRILRQFATSLSRGSAQPRDRTHVSYVSCIGRKFLYQEHYPGLAHGHVWKKVKVKVTQSCPNLCDPVDLVHGILQARILEWVAFSFSRESFQPRDSTQVSHFADGFFTSWATRQVQEYWRGSLSLLQWIFQTQESNQISCIAGGFFTNWAMREAHGQVSVEFS